MSDITTMLGEMDKLKDKLDKKYSKNITIMFTDIKDSTVYFEKHGDMNGRMLIEKHNSMLFPIVKKYGGVIIKTIGDAIMAKYDFALNGVKAAIEMQRVLKEYNEEARDKIRIRIGLHTGKAIVEENDVFGDSVNLAARIESGTKAEFITISKNTLVEIAAYKNIKVKKIGVVKYKGKEEEIETYSVLWDSSILEKNVRGDKTWLHDSLLLKLTLDDNKIKVRYRYYLNDEKKEEIFDSVDKRLFSKFFEYLKQLRASTLQKSSTSFEIEKFKEEGKKIYDILLGSSIDEVFKKADLSYLVIDTDRNFSFFPVGLLHDGNTFLGLKYPIFRLIDHFKEVEPVHTYFTFLDYTRDNMAEQEKEFKIISKKFKESNLSRFSPKKEYTNLEKLASILSNVTSKSSHLHFAFHNLFSILFDEIKVDGLSISYKDITKTSLKKDGKLRYIIANSCKTVPILTKFIDRRNQFLSFLEEANLKLYLGNLFNIYDEVGVYFSEVFYGLMLKGYSYPEAVYKTKLKLKDKYGEDSLIWASYVIFADSVESVLETMIENSINISQEHVVIKDEVKEVVNKENIRGNSNVIGNTEVIGEVGENLPSMSNNFSKLLLPLVAIVIVALIGFYFFNRNGYKKGHRSSATMVTDVAMQHRPKDKDNSAMQHRPEDKEKVKPKENLLLYKGVQQSDVKDENIAIKVKPSTEKNNRLVVLYFDNTSKNKKLDPLRKTLADMLISDISDLQSVNVVEREKLEDIIKELNLSKTKYIDRKSALKIGRMLSAKYIMIGSFIDPPIEGLPLRVDAKIIDVETSEIKWAKGVTGEKKDLYKLEKKLFRKFKKSKFINKIK